jgi:large repetitive protein
LAFSMVSGILPPGLNLSAGGTISGIPAQVTQTTNFQFRVRATDTVNSSDTQSFQLSVLPQPLTISTSALNSGTAGVNYSSPLAAVGGAPPYRWSLTGVLPTGIQLDTSAGQFFGTPSEGGSFPLVVTVTDQQGNQATKAFILAIKSNLSINSPTQLPSGFAGASYTYRLQTAGASGNVSWSITQGALADGLSLDRGNGTISGIPSRVGTFNPRVRVQDATGSAASQVFTLVIGPASLPAVTITGLGSTVQPGQQTPIALSLSTGFPLDITGQLAVTFTPGPGITAIDPTVRFGGGSSVTFRISANTTQAVFDQSSTLQTGSLSGTISLNVSLQSGGAPASTTSITGASGTLPPLPPVIVGTPVANITGNTIQISLNAFSTTRKVTSGNYHFTFTAGANQAPIDVPVNLSTLVSGWYDTPDSLSFGSSFGLTENFLVNGNVSQINGVTITLSNDQGTSQPVSVSF